jgi:N-acyl-D-amino-acid deacylase
MHDLVIRNALIVDGLGVTPYHGDLAVAGGTIAEIGRSLSGKEVVDAAGLALMPGIVDNHTHYDAQITWDPLVAPSPALGVTTAIIGNCGFTIAPCKPADRELVMKNLTQVEGMSLEVLRAGIRWDFESIPEYFRMLERRGAAINVAGFVGHSSLRTYVMGAQALWDSLPALRPRTTAMAACRCLRGSPTTPRCARWSAPCATPAAAYSC